MCGIAGSVGFATLPDVRQTAQMTRGLQHRGPDDEGIWVSDGGTCVLGHRRLSVIDLSQGGHQPMVDPVSGNAITFNGEIYNYRELRTECEAKGEKFLSTSDTEVILVLYRRLGADCLARLRGMFAFAIWDEKKKSLFLARDRVGKKPLNYAVSGKSIAFASELRPLSKFPGINVSLDAGALGLYLQHQSVPAPHTIYAGIKKLPPAHFAIFNAEGISISKYWDVSYREKVRFKDDSEAVDALEEKLTDAIRLRMISDVPLGALLSGGVDSSVIVAIMSKLSARPVKTFSIGFDESSHNELPFADFVARTCATEHFSKVADGNLGALIPQIVRQYGEPFADSSALPSFLVSRIAREHVTVVLNGDGGDELLGGYQRYGFSRIEGVLGGIGTRAPIWLKETLANLILGKSLSARIARRIATRLLAPELRSVLMYSAYWDDGERAELLVTKSLPNLSSDWRQKMLKGAAEAASHFLDRMLWIDNQSYLPDTLLVKMDIASMHVGLEARSPLLDHQLIEFCARLPVHLKSHQGHGKYLLKMLAQRYFPKDFVFRKKMGFAIPQAKWLLGPLRPLLRATLNDGSLMAPLNLPRVSRELEEFERGKTANQSRLWALLMYGQWRASEQAG